MGVLLVAALPAVQPPRSDAQPLVTGLSELGNYEPLAFARARATGAKLVRITVPWLGVAPAGEPGNWSPENPADPHYDWVWLDKAVTEATTAGLIPVLQIYGGPRWAQRCVPPPFAYSTVCDPDPAALAAFATAAARRYSGDFRGLPRVRYWQALDEPNLSLFFNPQFEAGRPVSATLYRQLINVFYRAVKAVNRTNLVLAAGLGPIAVPGYTIGPMSFTRELLCMRGGRHPHRAPGSCEGGVHFDIFDIHPYTTGGPTHKGGANDVELGDLPKLQALIGAADRAGRIKGRFRHTPLWVGEFSWDSKPPDPGGLPMRIETRWTAEALYRAWTAGVDNFFWYNLRDAPYEPNRPFSETLQSGLYFRGATIEQDQPKEVMYAFRFPFVAYPQRLGLFFWGRTPSSAPGRVTIQLLRGRRWRRELVVHASRQGMFSGLIRTPYGRHRHGSARAVYRGAAAVPFSMRPVHDFYQPPFG